MVLIVPNPFAAVSAVDSGVRNLPSCESPGQRRVSPSTARATDVGRGCVGRRQRTGWLSLNVLTRRCLAGRSPVRGDVRSTPMTNVQSANSSAAGPTVTNTRMRIDSSIREAKTTVKG